MATYYKNITASAMVKEGAGRLVGIFVASTTSGTIKVWDNITATAPVIVNTFTPAAATYYPFPDATFTRGLFITLANTIDCTIFFE